MTRSGLPLLLALLSLPAQAQLRPVPPEAQLAGEDAYRLQRGGDPHGALLAIERALQQAPGHPEWRRLKLDLLADTGALAEAEALSGQLAAESPGDARLVLQRVYLLQRLGRPEEAVLCGSGLLEPGIAPDLQRSARLALADLRQAMGQPGPALAVLAPAAEDPDPEIQSRRGFILLRQGFAAEAGQAFSLALQGDLDPARRRSLLQGHLEAGRMAGNQAGVVRDLEELQRLDPENGTLGLELAYAQLGVGHDPEAFAAFQAALGPEAPPAAWLDGAYTARRLGRNRQAAAWFTKGLEVRRQLPEYQGDAEPEFGLRREVEALDRSWGISLGSFYRQGGLLPGVFSSQKALQQGLDVFWQPGALARDGRNVQFFAEGFENLWSSARGATGGPTVQWALGARAKPFRQQNLVVGAERLFRGGELALSDWMLKAGYSLDRGVDLRPWDRRWPFLSVFTEGASLARSGRYLQSLEAKLGESYRFDLAPATAWTPHLVLAGDHDSRDPSQTATGIGAGLQMRTWFRGTDVKAPASWFEVSIQARARLTDSGREDGLFLRANLWF